MDGRHDDGGFRAGSRRTWRFLGSDCGAFTTHVARPVDARPVGCISWRLRDRRARSASPIVVRVNVWHDEVCGVPVFAP